MENKSNLKERGFTISPEAVEQQYQAETDNSMPGHPPVQTVGAAFSTVTGEAPPTLGFGIHECIWPTCHALLLALGPRLCPQHQVKAVGLSSGTSEAPPFQNYHECAWSSCRTLISEGGPLYCPQHQPKAAPPPCPEICHPIMLVAVNLATGASIPYPRIDESLLPVVEAFLKALAARQT